MAEVKLGQLAADKGNSEDVKQFGQKMVQDHTKLGEQMKGVAGQIGVTPPTMLSPGDKALEAKLKMLSGDAFDKAYIQAMVKDHQTDLADFNKEASNGTSQVVKDAANDGSKVVAMHLDMIQKIAASHNVASN
jgi:putative membrane protein